MADAAVSTQSGSFVLAEERVLPNMIISVLNISSAWRSSMLLILCSII